MYQNTPTTGNGERNWIICIFHTLFCAWNVKGSRLNSVAPVHSEMCRISVQSIQISSGLLEMCEFPVISPAMCFTWNGTCHAVLCSCTWTVHITVCAVGLQWHKMCRKCPQHPRSSLPTTAAERIKLFTGCYFFACLFFSHHDMNVFVTDFTVDHVLTHVQGFSSGILFSEISDWNCNCKGVKLPSGCVVPGSRSSHTFGCCFVNCRGGLMRWTISGFLVLLGWAPCQVGTRPVELAGLSSKSTCNLCVAFGVQGAVLASAFLCPVCSISWLGSSREEGPIPIGELEQIDLMCVFKVGDICWLILKQVRCRK